VAEQNGSGLVPQSTGFLEQQQGPDGSLATLGREQSGIQAGLVIAKRFPRDETRAAASILNTCRRAGFAERARYSFPRGGSTVEGPSIVLAREMAIRWGNVRHGFTVTEWTPDRVTVEGWAVDLETNTWATSSATFARRVQRKNKQTRQTEWVKPDERDERELVNRHGATAQRNAILQVIPRDIVDDAMTQVRKTLVDAEAGHLKSDPARARRLLLSALMDLGVTPDQVDAYLGRPLDQATAEQMADLKGVGQAIAEGQVTRDEVFPPTQREGSPQAARPTDPLDALAASLPNAEPNPATQPAPVTNAPQAPTGAQGGPTTVDCPGCGAKLTDGASLCPDPDCPSNVTGTVQEPITKGSRKR